AEILAAVRYPTRPDPTLTLDVSEQARTHPALPVVDIGTFTATQQGFDEPAARSEASRCFRCDAVYGCPSVSVVAGRGPGHSRGGGGPAQPLPASATPFVTADPGAPGGAQ